ncbi:MAG: oxidative damage protection protein [Chloroflexi bacterium]|nr:oxidative damage protection protein [Chloroflexota bacterium]
MPRMVKCVKLGRELPGLERPPISGELGQRIFEHVSAEAWGMWRAQQTILMNHYGLNPMDPEAREFLRRQAEEFFFGQNAQMPEGWEAPPAQKGGPPAQKGGGARRK